MKKLMTLLALATFAMLIAVASTPPAYGQSSLENSTFTVTEPLEVGAYTLQPGTYLISVVMQKADRFTIQVTNVERTTVFATVLSTPHPVRNDEMISSSRYIYYSTPPGQIKALRTWFARDAANGHDIVYPRKRAMELAAAVKEPVIAVPDEVKEAEYKTAPLLFVTPEQEVKPYETPAPVAVAEAVPPKELPRTASDVPLFAALGLLSLGGAFGLRALTNRAS
jgi:hypothetical protein